jgi:hypothetical protein
MRASQQKSLGQSEAGFRFSSATQKTKTDEKRITYLRVRVLGESHTNGGGKSLPKPLGNIFPRMRLKPSRSKNPILREAARVEKHELFTPLTSL